MEVEQGIPLSLTAQYNIHAYLIIFIHCILQNGARHGRTEGGWGSFPPLDCHLPPIHLTG